jgi:glycosyltransferase involved in cell wall biosynthesis
MHCLYFPPEVGGLESHVYYLCRGLVEKGHQVAVVTSRSLPGLPTKEMMDGIAVFRTWMPSRNPVGWSLHAASSTPRIGGLAAHVDVVHAQAFQSVLPAVVAKKTAGVPIVTTWHTSHFLKRAESPFWRPIFQKMMRWSDYNLAASKEIASVAEDLASDVRVEALTNGVETSFFRRTAPTLDATIGSGPDRGPRKRIIVPRRLFEKNGVEYFVRALPRIAAAVDVEAVLIGDGPERGRLEALASQLELGDRIRFLGARPHQEMPGLLSSGDLAVFPSLMEATSVAALESMACELPVAASNVGGLPEIIDASVGGLFEPADPFDLSDVVIDLLKRDDLSEVGRTARERVVGQWSNARLVDRHIEIYQQVVESGAEARTREVAK